MVFMATYNTIVILSPAAIAAAYDIIIKTNIIVVNKIVKIIT